MIFKTPDFAKLFFTLFAKLYTADAALYDVRMQLWTSGSSVLKATYTWQDAVAFIHSDPSALKGWSSDPTPRAFCSLVHSASWGRIWSLSFFYNLNALFVRDMIIPLFEENDYVLIPFWGEIEKGLYDHLLKNARFPDNFYFLGNCDSGTKILHANGLQAFTVSPNAFIDHNLFCPIETPRLYDAIYLGECRPQKRLNLAALVLENLLIVTHSSNEKVKEVVDKSKILIYNPSASLIPHYINQASCGLILSATEGGCYASTEYLYCGIPVLSTKSYGGRDIYYDDITALIVDDTPEAVQKGVDTLCKRAPNPWQIRQHALAISDKMLNTLADQILLPIFQRYQDPHAADPRGFVNDKINMSQRKLSKGRTVFQPEIPTHETIEKIQREQKK